MNSLAELMHAKLGSNGFVIKGEKDLYAEIVDTATGMVWMTTSPASQEELDGLQLPDGFVASGVGMSAMDKAGFRHSPNAKNEAPKVQQIAGREFLNVATPEKVEPPLQEGGPLRVIVNKAHVIGFKAGREICVMETAEGSFVELVGTPDNDASLVLPEEASLRKLKLDAPLVIGLPTPTVTYFWMRPSDLRSFQGPVNLPT